MNAARRLLRKTNQSIVATALDLGGSSASHFAQVLRRDAGLPPRDYRRPR